MWATHLDLQRELFHGKAEDKNSEPVTIALTVVVDSENDKLMAFSIQATTSDGEVSPPIFVHPLSYFPPATVWVSIAKSTQSQLDDGTEHDIIEIKGVKIFSRLMDLFIKAGARRHEVSAPKATASPAPTQGNLGADDGAESDYNRDLFSLLAPYESHAAVLFLSRLSTLISPCAVSGKAPERACRVGGEGEGCGYPHLGV